MSILRYSVTVQFDVAANDPGLVEEKLNALSEIGEIASVKAKSAGKTLKEIDEAGE